MMKCEHQLDMKRIMTSLPAAARYPFLPQMLSIPGFGYPDCTSKIVMAAPPANPYLAPSELIVRHNQAESCMQEVYWRSNSSFTQRASCATVPTPQ